MNRHTGSQNNSQPRAPQPQHSAKDKDQPPQHTGAKERGAEESGVEGEGSYTATHHYNEGVREHLRTHDVESEAEEAREALEGPERAELEQAEQQGKSRAAEREHTLRGVGAPKQAAPRSPQPAKRDSTKQ